MKLVDRWRECYTGVHQETSPEEFKNLFCNNCMNASCSLSKGSGMSWVQRMTTQADRLLNNPNFAHIQDPEFQAIRNMDFKSMLHREISLNISSQKGDWEVPSDIEVSIEASKLVGKLTGEETTPIAFQSQQDLNPDLLEGAPEPIIETPKPVIEEPTPTIIEEPVREPISSWKLKGDKDTYSVSLFDGGDWECTCPYYEHKQEPCKHIMKIRSSYNTNIKPEPKEESKVVPRRPPPVSNTPSLNTAQPQGGYVIGSEPVKAVEPVIDPWAAPKENPPTGNIPVGGTFTFGSKKK